MRVSDCCGAPDRTIDCDSSYEDHGFCPECRDHCEFVEQEDED